MSLLAEGDYFALLAYLPPGSDLLADVAALRRDVRDRAHVATTLGIGPRYLHSTGQLHKGGPNTGVFLLITGAPEADVDIPGEPFTFGTLERAQALGDFASLDAAGRRVVHAHLPARERRYIAGACGRDLAVGHRLTITAMRYLVTARVKAGQARRFPRPSTTAASAGVRSPATNTSATCQTPAPTTTAGCSGLRSATAHAARRRAGVPGRVFRPREGAGCACPQPLQGSERHGALVLQ